MRHCMYYLNVVLFIYKVLLSFTEKVYSMVDFVCRCSASVIQCTTLLLQCIISYYKLDCIDNFVKKQPRSVQVIILLLHRSQASTICSTPLQQSWVSKCSSPVSPSWSRFWYQKPFWSSDSGTTSARC